MRRLLGGVATAFALSGGLLLVAVALTTAVSVAGRWFAGQPITGDIELVQLAVAAAIALCLPYCQLHRSHLVVDFFTARWSGPAQRRLDAAGSLLAGALFLVLAWRAGIAVVDMRRVSETSMVLGIPLWIAYAFMVPGLAFACLAGLVQPFAERARPRSAA